MMTIAKQTFVSESVYTVTIWRLLSLFPNAVGTILNRNIFVPDLTFCTFTSHPIRNVRKSEELRYLILCTFLIIVYYLSFPIFRFNSLFVFSTKRKFTTAMSLFPVGIHQKSSTPQTV